MELRPSNTNSTPPELRLRYNELELVLGTFDHCVLSVWRRDLSASSVFHMLRAIQDLRTADAKARVMLISFVEPDCAVPANEDVARAWSDMLKRHEGVVVGTTVVYEREGFWSASMRSQVMAINTESKAGIPHYVTPSLQAACSWAAELLGGAPSGSALLEAVQTLRSTAAARAAL